MHLERRALERAHRVLAWTDWAARGVRRAAPGAKVVVLFPGIDLQTFRPSAKVPHDRTRVLFVGARFKGKGGLDLVAALGPELGTKFELDVVSQEQPPPSPTIRCHQLDPGDPRLIELYQQADVFCMPSYADSAGWAVVEAMACQLPVIGSTVGGMPDVIGDAGIVIRPGDRNELRAVLHRLADDRSLRERLGRQARSRAEQSLNATVQTAKLIELMKAAVS